jgi:hypothetical protein
MNKTGYHICIVCSRLDLQGGIERACVNLANLFYKYEHKVTILILDSTAELFYPVEEGIIIVQENLHFGITEKGNTLIRKAQFLKHIVRLRSIYKNMAADFIISTEYSLTIPSCFKTACHQTDRLGTPSFFLDAEKYILGFTISLRLSQTMYYRESKQH